MASPARGEASDSHVPVAERGRAASERTGLRTPAGLLPSDSASLFRCERASTSCTPLRREGRREMYQPIPSKGEEPASLMSCSDQRAGRQRATQVVLAIIAVAITPVTVVLTTTT